MSKKNNNLHLGIIQFASEPDPQANVRKAARLVRKCAEQQCDLVCLQELFHTTYFCQTTDPIFFDWALDRKGDVILQFSELARELEVVLVLPYFEKRAAGLYHNSLVIFDSDGSIAGDYRKAHIPDDPGFYEKYYFTPGEEPFQIIETSIGKIGAMICWDQWFPEAARIMTLKGADLLVYPTAIGTLTTESEKDKAEFLDAWQTIQRSHAIANGIPVISVNRVGTENDLTFWGHSFVSGPFGQMLVEADETEGIWTTEIDLNQIEEQRRIWPFLRDRRIDLYDDIVKRYDD